MYILFCGYVEGGISIFHFSNSVWMSNLLSNNPKIKLSSIQCLVIVYIGLGK